MKGMDFSKFRNYGASTAVALILAATAGCAGQARSVWAGVARHLQTSEIWSTRISMLTENDGSPRL